MSVFSILALLLLGVVIILIEFFLIPGTTIVGFVGFAIKLVAVYFGFSNLGMFYGSVLLCGSSLVLGGAMYWAIKKQTWKLFALNKSVEGKLKKRTLNVSIGDEGIAISSIRPSGEALFKEEVLEVHSQGGFIEVNSKINIILVEDNKIYVKPI
jgi:membrane-bound ClpP family serine protease